jgi:hypothetical protein
VRDRGERARRERWPYFGGGGGWTVIGTPDVSTNGNSLVAYRIVDGSGEQHLSFSWTGNDNGVGVILQYSGDFSSNPIGNIHQNALSRFPTRR